MIVRVAQTAPDRVLFGARAPSRAAARHGIARMRFALGVDDDLRAVPEGVQARPADRALGAHAPVAAGERGGPEPFEALAWAICEQLIEYERAAAIERRMLAALGRSWRALGRRARAARGGLRDLPHARRARRHRAGAAAVLRPRRRSRAGARARGARGRARARATCTPPTTSAGWRQAARDPGDRRVDGGDARAHRPGPPRPAAGRRSRLAEARRAAPQRRRSARPRERSAGARVLRALRALGGPRGRAHAAGPDAAPPRARSDGARGAPSSAAATRPAALAFAFDEQRERRAGLRGARGVRDELAVERASRRRSDSPTRRARCARAAARRTSRAPRRRSG